MKKMLVSSALAFAMASSAVVAEESGVFVGLGYAGKYTSSVDRNTPGTTTKTSTNEFNYEILAGYKHFFTDSFGIRGYAHFQQDHTNTITNISIGSESGEFDAPQGEFRYGVNVDALYNVFNNESGDFGLFAGARLGLSTVTGDVADGLAMRHKDYKWTDFVAGLNLGLRGTFAKAHGVELAFYVPLKNHVYLDKPGIKEEEPTRYNASLRYTYSF